MADTVVGPLVCPQGHGPGVPGSRFCTMCGSGLIAEAQMAPQPVAMGVPLAANGKPPCKVCGGSGAGLSAAEIVCPACEWLRPLMPGYQMDRSVFLVCYVGNYALHGESHYPGHSLARTIYLVILVSHVLLSMVALPLVLVTFFFSLTGRIPTHRKVARWTFPIWLYVSVTGVIVYAMLAAAKG